MRYTMLFLLLFAPIVSSADPAQVRIVKQGLEHNRTGDGNAFGISHYHRYRIDRDSVSNLWKIRSAPSDIQEFHNIDLDNDGNTDDDLAAGHVFDLNPDNPLTPVAPWYDTSVGSQRFYGAAVLLQADAPTGYSSIFSEDGMNDSEEGAVQQPRRNWTFFHETYEIGSPYRMYFLALWQKHDFLNGGAEHRVSFDEESELRHLVMRYNMGIEGFRWVVRNGDQFYISEQIYRGADDDPKRVGGKIHTVKPATIRWAEYNPQAPLKIWFDSQDAVFEKRDFDDVTAVGWLMFKDTLVSGYVGYKWYAFEADALVDRPFTPSQHLDMKEVRADGIPPFYMSTTEIPYELWRKVHRLARANTFAGTPGYNFDRYGDMGSMDFPDADGNYLSHSPNEPATDMTFYDALVWCNALSEQESLEPCYYVDSEFTQPFREAVRSPIWGDNGNRRPVYVKWNADGYRLPTPAEWVAAAKDSTQMPAGESTLTVDSGSPDKNGFYHLTDNAMELTWTQGDSIPENGLEQFTVLGGNFATRRSASAYGDRPFDGNGNIGFRPVRRAAGLPAPSLENPSFKFARWNIKPNTVLAPEPSRQLKAPLAQPWLEQVVPDGQNFSLGKTEVTFEQWMPVHDWAVAHGYQFDDDGDMGSMAYWGFGDNWKPAAHSPDEPVTGISKYDAMLWLNALSELEGREPVYQLNGEPVKTSFIYRPLHLLLGQAQHMQWDGILPLHSNNRNSWQDWVADPAADGYRLPELEEYEALAIKSGAYPLQDSSLLDSAWMADNSGFTTHPAASKPADRFGLHDMLGNVSELCNSGNTHKSYRRNSLSYCPQFGGSFIDVLQQKFPGMADNPVAMGLAWPDIGFRALRQTPATAPQAKAPAPATAKLEKQSGSWWNLLGLLAPPVFAEEAPTGFDPLQGQVHRGNLYRTGIYRSSGLPQKTGIAWSFETGGPVRSSPVLVDGTLYIGSYDGFVYALNASDGSLKWKFETAGRIGGSAAVADGIVYIASEGGALYALDAQSGEKLWEAKLSGTCAGSPAVINGQVVIGQGARYGGSEILIMSAHPLTAFDALTGEKIWQGAPGPQGYAAIAADGRNLYAGFNGSYFAVFNPKDGKTSKVWNGGHQARQFMSITADKDRLYIPVTMRGSVMCTDLEGKQIWHTATLDHNMEFEMNAGGTFGYEIFTDLAVSDTTVYAGCNDGKLYTFDKESGEKGWTFTTGDEIHSSPSIAGNMVYFGSWDGNLYALDTKTGQQLWKQPLGGRIVSSPWPGNGTVYIGCDNGSVYAIR